MHFCSLSPSLIYRFVLLRRCFHVPRVDHRSKKRASSAPRIGLSHVQRVSQGFTCATRPLERAPPTTPRHSSPWEVSRARSAARANRSALSIPVVTGCAPPSTRRAIRAVSSPSVVTASRRSSSVALLVGLCRATRINRSAFASVRITRPRGCSRLSPRTRARHGYHFRSSDGTSLRAVHRGAHHL